MLKRRDILLASLAAPFAWLGMRRAVAAPAARLVAVGIKPPGKLPYRGEAVAQSMLVVMDTQTGKWRSVTLEIPEAHALVRVPGGYAVVGNHRALALVGDDLSPRSVVTAPAGWEFGGHGVWVEAQRRLVVGMRPARDGTLVEVGRLARVDVERAALDGDAPSGGFDPHDMLPLGDGRLIVCNYGDKRRADLMDYRAIDPRLAIIDGNTLTVVDTIEPPRLGAVSHLALGRGAVIAAIPARLHALSENGLASAGAQALGAPIDLSAVEVIEGKVGAPSPVLTLDLATRAWRSHLTEPERQRRPQSILHHPGRDAWLVTYPYSESIGRLDADGKLTLVSAFELGLAFPRGLALVPGDDAVYVAGQYRGVVRVDVDTLRAEERWDVPLYDATHLHVA
jgi:hypothetical protein